MRYKYQGLTRTNSEGSTRFSESGWEEDDMLVEATGKDLDILSEIPVTTLSHSEIREALAEELSAEEENMIEVLMQEEKTIHYCPYGDCGWCYYDGDKETNDNNGQCNSPQECKVNINEE